jgi:hypothetical protein
MRDVLRERFLIKFGIYIGINLFQNVKNKIILNAIQFLVFKAKIFNIISSFLSAPLAIRIGELR